MCCNVHVVDSFKIDLNAVISPWNNPPSGSENHSNFYEKICVFDTICNIVYSNDNKMD